MCDLVLFDNFNLLNCKWISNGLHDSFYSFSSRASGMGKSQSSFTLLKSLFKFEATR